MAIKRMNYFKGEFLHAQDFKDEQRYHVDMLRRHNKNLHTWGIAEGLDIAFVDGEKKITVTKGMAIDAEGKQIILLEDKEIDLSTFTETTLYISVSYKETPTDPRDETGIKDNTRITEEVNIRCEKDRPSDPSVELILAKVILNPDKTVKEIDKSERKNAGVIGGDLEVKSIAFSLPVAADKWPRIKGVNGENPGIEIISKKTNFTGDLEIAGDLNVKGIVNKTGELEIKDNIIRVNKYAPQATPLNVNGGLEVYRGGTAPNAQLIWDESVDRWKMGLERGLADIAYGPNADRLLNNSVADGLHKHSSLSTPAGSLALSVDAGGRVGIGVADPQRTLDVRGFEINSGGNIVNHRAGFSFHNRQIAGFVETPANGERWVWYADGTARNGKACLWSGNNKLVIDKDGNVGIGTSLNYDLNDKLEVTGNLRILTDSNPIRFTSRWSEFPDAVTNQAEISNDTGTYKTLMIVGNRSAGLGRRVSVWDRLEVNGSQKITGRLGTNNYDPNSGYPSGWTGGIHTWDVYAEGSVGCGTNGSLNVYINRDGYAYKTTGGNWSTLSDERLKKNIKPLKGSLAKMLKLRGVSYEWKEPEKFSNLTGEQIGLISQEVEEVFPDWVHEGPDGYKNLTIRGFEALTIEAFRDLNNENENLKSKVKELENKFKILEKLKRE